MGGFQVPPLLIPLLIIIIIITGIRHTSRNLRTQELPIQMAGILGGGGGCILFAAPRQAYESGHE